MKQIPKLGTKLPLGNPNGHTLWNWWARSELQGSDNVRYAFLVFEGEESKILRARQQIIQSLGKNLGLVSSVEIENPIGEAPVRVYKSRNTFYGFFYVTSNHGNQENQWMYQCSPLFERDQGLEKQMDDVAIDKHARYISRRR